MFAAIPGIVANCDRTSGEIAADFTSSVENEAIWNRQ